MPTSLSRWNTSLMNRHSQVGSYSTYISRRKSSMMLTCRAAWLFCSDDFARQLVGRGDELEAAGVVGREREIDRLRGVRRDGSLTDV